ncbi:MAG: NADH-quinone oxidoreductase subunit NuoE [Alphaproteobacteria bacterium]
MSVRRLAKDQPEEFAFTPQNQKMAQTRIGKYPPDRRASAIVPLLWMAQKQHDGWLPEPAIRHVADILGMAYIRALEIATFYTMFNLAPVGRHHVQLCGTTPCWLRGANELKDVCAEVIGAPGTVSKDGALSWIEVECLGACCNAPMVQINDDYYEDLTPDLLTSLLDDLRAGRETKIGPQSGRKASEPAGGPTTLTDPSLYKRGGRQPTKPSTETVVAEQKPDLFEASPPDEVDDLTLISGVGPKLMGVLNELGIFRFDQVSAWTEAQIAWVDTRLKFKGRIAREGWIAQAKILASGADTEFSAQHRKSAKKTGSSV